MIHHLSCDVSGYEDLNVTRAFQSIFGHSYKVFFSLHVVKNFSRLSSQFMVVSFFESINKFTFLT